MIPLQTQEEFEKLYKETALKAPILIYFTASWCGACTRLDHDLIHKSFPGVTWYKCDIDVNKYTLGYCGLQKIPSFAIIKNSKFLGKFSSSDTSTVIEMISGSF